MLAFALHVQVRDWKSEDAFLQSGPANPIPPSSYAMGNPTSATSTSTVPSSGQPMPPVPGHINQQANGNANSAGLASTSNGSTSIVNNSTASAAGGASSFTSTGQHRKPALGLSWSYAASVRVLLEGQKCLMTLDKHPRRACGGSGERYSIASAGFIDAPVAATTQPQQQQMGTAQHVGQQQQRQQQQQQQQQQQHQQYGQGAR